MPNNRIYEVFLINDFSVVHYTGTVPVLLYASEIRPQQSISSVIPKHNKEGSDTKASVNESLCVFVDKFFVPYLFGGCAMPTTATTCSTTAHTHTHTTTLERQKCVHRPFGFHTPRDL